MMMSFRLEFLPFICFLTVLLNGVQCGESCNLDFERTLVNIFSPQDQPTTEMRNFRRYLLRSLQKMMSRTEEIEGWNTFAYSKRNLEALARGGYLHTLAQDENFTQANDKEKRSFSSLVKNKQLPIHRYTSEDSSKRSIEPLDSSINIQQEIQNMLDELYDDPQEDVTNIKTSFPSRELLGAGSGSKRNHDAASNNDLYLNKFQHGFQDKIKKSFYKGNHGSIYGKEIAKPKDYYFEDEYPAYNTHDGYNYIAAEDLLREKQAQKRFLGRLPQMGKTKTTSSPKTQLH